MSDLTREQLGLTCQHGHLARSCETCELTADRDAALALAEETEKDKVAARLDAQNERRRADLAEQRESVTAADLAALRAWAVTVIDECADRTAWMRGELLAEGRRLVSASDTAKLTGGRG